MYFVSFLGMYIETLLSPYEAGILHWQGHQSPVLWQRALLSLWTYLISISHGTPNYGIPLVKGVWALSRIILFTLPQNQIFLVLGHHAVSSTSHQEAVRPEKAASCRIVLP